MSQQPLSPAIVQRLASAKTIAVIGLSSRPDRSSYEVAQYLQAHGYRIVPVNPKETEVLGERCYPTLDAVPIRVDIVDIFRLPEAVPAIVVEAIRMKHNGRGPDMMWMQQGIVHEAAAEEARAAGLTVVMDRCLMIEHRRLTSPQPSP